MSRHFRPEPWLITAAFVVPFVLATIFLYGGFASEMLGRTGNLDRLLIEPPVQFDLEPQRALGSGQRYRWVVIYARITQCEPQCVRHLERLQQVHLALGRHGERVHRLYLDLDEDQAETQGPPAHPGLLIAHATDAQRSILLSLPDGHDASNGRLFIVDPRGNLVASYPGDAGQRGLLRDLRRLLDTSRTG